MIRGILFFIGFMFFQISLWGQTGKIEGIITDSLQQPISLVNISIADSNKGTATNKNGQFSLTVPAEQDIIINVSHSQYLPQTFNLKLEENEVFQLNIELKLSTVYLKELEIGDDENYQIRQEAGALELDPKDLKAIPTPFLDFNQAIISSGALGVVGNNELSSSYSVRGGNFDENLVYVNNIQVYRPFLVKAGQQEGLSFVNPDMVSGVSFSSGGWQSKYGDKLSSVLNVTYREPTRTSATLVAGLLGGSFYLEGASKNKKVKYLAGVRHKSSKYLLNSLETQGQYLPKFTDAQSYVHIDLSGKGKAKETTTLGILGSIASNRYELLPESRTTNFGTFNQSFRLNVLFVGSEQLNYDTFQGGIKLSHKFNSKFTSHFITSAMTTREREYSNVEGGYELCDVNTNFNSDNFNECAIVRGFGSEFTYSRNALEAQIYSAELRNEYQWNPLTKIEFGLRYDRQIISDKLHEYTFLDSADFVRDIRLRVGQNDLVTNIISGYAQASHLIGEIHSLTYGARFNYRDFNDELLISPRIQYALHPNWRKNMVFRAALGLYQQPPFYREMRDFNGNLNPDLKAQSSLHAITGLDYDFTAWDRPFKFITEVYYKKLWNVVPYDIDNVRLRYYAKNNAEAYVYGADFRVSGEFIPHTESWFSLGYLKAFEDVEGDGRGEIRRPSDQRLTFTFFFQDHLPKDPSLRVYIRTLIGSGLPYGPPESPEYRQAFRSGSEYVRSDIGFSKIFTFKQPEGKRSVESLWFGIEVLNLFGVENHISYNWVPDFSGNLFAVPNSLSQRFFNARIVLKY